MRTDLREHAAFGGVVPEVAARAHVLVLDSIIALAVEQSGHTFEELAAVAATAGPGLIGGVMVGLTTAKAIAIAHDRPLIPINHLEGHALSVRMTGSVEFPYLLLLISGGHTQLIHVEGVGRYRRLGATMDDAAGEAFDKSAKLLGLGYPGGPALAKLAAGGDEHRFPLPRPLINSGDLDFSFSGLKTAVRLLIEKQSEDTQSRSDIAAGQQVRSDIAAGVQAAIVDVLVTKAVAAVQMTGVRELVVAGGVGANTRLRELLRERAARDGFRVYYPPLEFCTDNGAMIALAGALRLSASSENPSSAGSMRLAASGASERGTTGEALGLQALRKADSSDAYGFSVAPRWDLASLAPVAP